MLRRTVRKPAKGASTDPLQLSLLDDAEPEDSSAILSASLEWPDLRRFPINWRDIKARSIVIPDLLSSTSPLIVAGYSSLDEVIQVLGGEQKPGCVQNFRIVFGAEPFESRTSNVTTKGQTFPAQVHAFWLERGISLINSAKIIRAIEGIESGFVHTRYLGSNHRRLHAKIYLGDDAVTLGSSNFTAAGLANQLEANVRFVKSVDRTRFHEAASIAENYWQLASDYDQELLVLLRALLKVVTWQEALARACAELLEGEWALRFIDTSRDSSETPLWPSQKVGIARAMWIVETVGSVLIADATGSGKTRMGVHLLRAMMNMAWSKGSAKPHLSLGLPVLVSPASVMPSWQREATCCHLPLQIRSSSILSQANGKNMDESVLAVKHAQILAIDEAHNYLNLESNRSRRLLSNRADHVVLFTATPINKGSTDLLSLIDWLGPDNLDDDILNMLTQRLRAKSRSFRSLTHSETATLREAIQQFTVRRTKRMLNDLIAKAPQDYVDSDGKACRYPEHRACIYKLPSPPSDLQIARKIRALAESLHGTWLLGDHIKKPNAWHQNSLDLRIAHNRLTMASALACFHVMAALRSSRAALYECLLGTEAALRRYCVARPDAKKHATGNAVHKIRMTKNRGLPKWELDCEPPSYLASTELFVQACDHDLRVCIEIVKLLETLGSSREEGKARAIAEVFQRHKRILAFDSKLITLDVIRVELTKLIAPNLIRVVGGGNEQGRAALQSIFARDSTQTCIALCSDASSESINLQGASAVLLLDMPSVVRVAEQRIGRVDRMDSPFDHIEVWWPADPAEFAVRKHERIVQRHGVVKGLLGSNFDLPDLLLDKQLNEVVAVEEAIDELNQSLNEDPSEVTDALTQVNSLVSGERSLIPPEVYDVYKSISARVLSRVSLVRARHPWSFFCIKGALNGVPRWVMYTSEDADPLVMVDKICLRLRILLKDDVDSLSLDDHAAGLLTNFIVKLQNLEPLLLPKKKQRALQQMEAVTSIFAQRADEAGQHQIAKRWRALANAVGLGNRGITLDLDSVADHWLELIQPLMAERLRKRGRRKKPLLIADITKDILNVGWSIEYAEQHFGAIPVIQPIDQRIVACILGVGKS